MCKHKHTVRVSFFPSDTLICKDCGIEMPRPGYDEHGVRDYYVPGDWSGRRRSDQVKIGWLEGRIDETIYQCPRCCLVALIDDFDVGGADAGMMFCNQCGYEIEPLVGDVK